ncbi:hypothetical protein [Pseudomonas sp. Irchel 3E19]|uniref:hypothetical protein n=1 Tax=Pseudomonas sp. Irchel 3E19 TaxID=2008981 RepID=UPI0011408D51|nr:hypothetical protein [Pseudomonas sp. Irchel 3E19]
MKNRWVLQTFLRRSFIDYKFSVDLPEAQLCTRKFTLKTAKALYALYDSKAQCFSHIDNFRNKANKALGSCPYCGLPSNVTLDHYLPRNIEAFPEFSILTENLIPACNKYQSAKGEFFSKLKPSLSTRKNSFKNKLTQNTRKKFISTKFRKIIRTRPTFKQYPPRLIHPYLDCFIGAPIIRVKKEPTTLDFVTSASGKLSRRDRRNLIFHINKLNISDRASSYAEKYWLALISDFKDRAITSTALAKAELDHQLNSAYERSGKPINSIEISLIRSIREDEKSISHLVDSSMAQPPTKILISKAIRL